MTDRLRIYNGALLLLGELSLDLTNGLTENREARRLLDLVWNDGGVNACLEQAQWHFAMRTSRFDYDPAVTPEFGYQRAFPKPDDWVVTSGVFQDEFMNSPLLDYADEAGTWYADVDEIFVRYVSDDENYGLDFAKWPSTFTDYVKAYFASRIVHRIPSASKKIEWLLGPVGREENGFLFRTLLVAKNKDAMALPATFPARGSGTWVRARHAGMNRGSRDGGNTSSLIG